MHARTALLRSMYKMLRTTIGRAGDIKQLKYKKIQVDTVWTKEMKFIGMQRTPIGALL